MSILRMCAVGQVSRAGLYRFDPGTEGLDDDLDLRHELQRIGLEYPLYGRRRITAARRRPGSKRNHTNHKRRSSRSCQVKASGGSALLSLDMPLSSMSAVYQMQTILYQCFVQI